MTNIVPTNAKPLVSTSSKNSTDLIMVQKPQTLKDWEGTIYCSNAGKGSSIPTTSEHYLNLISYLYSVSRYMSATYTALRYNALGYEEYNGETTLTAFNDMLSAHTSTPEYSATVFMRGLVDNRHQIVVPSTRYKGGFDISFCGTPLTEEDKSTCMYVNPWFGRYSIDDVVTDNEVIEKLQSSKGKHSQEAGYKILTAISNNPQAGKSDSAFKRYSNILSLTTDFKTLLQEAVNGKGSYNTLIDLKDFPILSRKVVASLQKYVSILVNVEPHTAEVNRRFEEVSKQAHLPVKKVDDYNRTLSPVITFSIVIHVPREWAEYISQVEINQSCSLHALTTWSSMWASGVLNPPNDRTRIRINDIPRYVQQSSQLFKLQETRSKRGLYTDAGRNNEDDVFISDTGRLHWCPKSVDMQDTNAKEYEKAIEQALELTYSVGSPLYSHLRGFTHKCYAIASDEYRGKMHQAKEELHRHAGKFQAVSWDYGTILTVAVTEPDKVNSYNLLGTATPSELSVSDYLHTPFMKSMATLFNRSVNEGNKRVKKDDFFKPIAFKSLSMFNLTVQLYQHFRGRGLVPTVQSLVEDAVKQLGLKTLSPQNSDLCPYDVGLYNGILTTEPNLINVIGTKDASCAETLMNLLLVSLGDANGHWGTNLERVAKQEGIEISEDDHYFNTVECSLAQFSNVYQYLGGRTFLLALKALQGVDKKHLYLTPKNPDSKLPNFLHIVQEVMPFVYIMGKYVPSHESIEHEANKQKQDTVQDDSITVDDVIVPGTAKDFKIFPHHLRAVQRLFHAKPPRFAVYDVAPGGGKTIQLETEICWMVGQGLIKRPLILAPNGLVRNWVEDLQKVTGTSWNVIPIITQVYKGNRITSWGEERLTDLIQNAPVNTIVVAGFSLLMLDPYDVVVHNHAFSVSGGLEFLKKFGFDYIGIDESHRAKNEGTFLNNAVKQLTTSTACKYVRLATGTLISNIMTDVVGQTRLFNAQIFKTAEEYESEYKHSVDVYSDSGKLVTRTVWKNDAPQMARDQLARHCCLVTAKRKDWAFMLPIPKEVFHPIYMEDEVGGESHQQLYESLLKATLEDIRSRDTSLVSLLEKTGESKGKKGSSLEDLDDDTLQEIEGALQPYLARLEQFITDPLGDPMFAENPHGEDVNGGLRLDSAMDRVISTFGKNYTASKVKKVIEIIKLNFVEIPWEQGKTYHIHDLVDFNDKRYVLMGELIDGKRVVLTEQNYGILYKSHTSPDKDPRWQEESQGKVIVFCRYTRIVNAIYNALPPELKKISVKFYGSKPGENDKFDKWKNMDAFKSTPYSTERGAQILIANEQAISEGHNLQMANCMIRVDSPWAPGTLDQSAARIFRPDPTKKYKREIINLHWIITDRTIEVAKMGRLISKMVTKTKFDEIAAGNTRYLKLNEEQYNLPIISMSIKPDKETVEIPILYYSNLESVQPYRDAYNVLQQITSLEFREMRQNQVSEMLPVKVYPSPAHFGIIDHVPYVPNMQPVDRHNLGLVKLSEYLEDVDNQEVRYILDDKKLLEGQYAHTEFGNGIIKRVSLTGKNGETPGIERSITSLQVELMNGTIVTSDPSLVYLISANVDEKKLRAFERDNKVRPTNAERELAKGVAEELVKRTVIDDRMTNHVKQEIRKEVDRSVIRTSKPIPVPKSERVHSVRLWQVIYNGYLAIEAEHVDEKDEWLEEYGYKAFGEYLYVTVPNRTVFGATRRYLEQIAILGTQTEDRLDDIEHAFDRSPNKFIPMLAHANEFPMFYNKVHKNYGIDKASGKPKVAVYPVIIEHSLMLCIDLISAPSMRRYIGKPIPTSSAKFAVGDAFYVKFFADRGSASAHIKELLAEGIDIENYKELVDEFNTNKFSADKYTQTKL